NLYRLKQIDYDGHFEYSKEISVELNQPIKIHLSQNYPNPFNPVTRIEYYIPVNTFVTLKIYDSMGNEIKKLVSEIKHRGKYSVTWNGTNDKNEKVSSGIYFYKLGNIEHQIIHKMIFLK
ncbi:MAG: FlgD immunoglobulin-like domain containing protein, partial [Ignavibacteriaceae bacterium]